MRRYQEPRIKEDKPVNWARLRQRYTSLTCRRQPVLDGVVFAGIVVEATDPKELTVETERVLALKEPQH